MKTNQLILAAALVALAACTKENVDFNANTLDNEIGFTAVTRKATKANNAIIDGTTYDHSNTFKVWGWNSAAGTFADVTDEAASNFMSGIEISWTKGREGVNSTRPEAWRNASQYYYWPYSGKISFLAIHPSTIVPTTTVWDGQNTKPKATINNYTICEDDPATTDVNEDNSTTDLMFATAAGSRSTGLDTDGNLPMQFKHALSQIAVYVKTDADYTVDNVRFDIDGVTFNGIDLTGSVTYENDAISWGATGAQTASWVYSNATKANITNTAALYGNPIVMIPQDANKLGDNDTNQTTITINYTMAQGGVETSDYIEVVAPWLKVKEGPTDYNPAEAIPGWEAGKKYNYTLNFKLKEILFSPSVTDWVEVDLQTVNANI